MYTCGHEHPQGLVAGWVAPGAQHDVGFLRVEISEVRGEVEGRETAGQGDATRLIAELRLDLLSGGVLGSAFEPLRECDERRHREPRHDYQARHGSTDHLSLHR
jgi:hypothetical protein